MAVKSEVARTKALMLAMSGDTEGAEKAFELYVSMTIPYMDMYLEKEQDIARKKLEDLNNTTVLLGPGAFTLDPEAIFGGGNAEFSGDSPNPPGVRRTGGGVVGGALDRNSGRAANVPSTGKPGKRSYSPFDWKPE